MTFWQNAFVSGSTFVLLWFAAAWCLEAVVGWAPPGHTLPALVLRGSVVGVIFGVGMAAYYRSQAQALNLPNWSEYVPPNQDDAA